MEIFLIYPRKVKFACHLHLAAYQIEWSFEPSGLFTASSHQASNILKPSLIFLLSFQSFCRFKIGHHHVKCFSVFKFLLRWRFSPSLLFLTHRSPGSFWARWRSIECPKTVDYNTPQKYNIFWVKWLYFVRDTAIAHKFTLCNLKPCTAKKGQLHVYANIIIERALRL